MVAQFIDVTASRQARALLEFQANHDPLTELKNRRAVLAALAATLSHPARTGTRLAVLYCDLDRFKPVNDADGHGVGDEVLVEAGRRIRRCVRQGRRTQGGDGVVRGPGAERRGRTCATRRSRCAIAQRRLTHAARRTDVLVTLECRHRAGRVWDNSMMCSPRRTARYEAKNAGRDRVVAYADLDADSL